MKTTHTFRSMTTAALLVFLTGVSQTSHGALALPDTPLIVGTSPPPNIFFALDDSGSMDWGLLTPQDNGIFNPSGVPYYYTHPGPDNLFFWTTATEQYLVNNRGMSVNQTQGIWRNYNSDFNKVYYNPAIDYRPWKGKDVNGATYTNANPTAARYNPYLPSVGTLNLTANTSYTTDFPGQGSFTVTGFFPAFYYRWTDSNNNGEVDTDDAKTLIEIKPATTTYQGGPNRADCAAAPICTYAEEIQNFANWFTYHRKRELALKRATSELIDNSQAYMGLATLHNNNSVGRAVRDMRDQSNKDELLKQLSRMDSNGGTPLRRTLDRVGQYFTDDGGNSHSGLGFSEQSPILPAEEGGACQQNFAVLMSDGFWNGSHSGTGNTDGDNNTDFDGGPHADNLSNTLADVAMKYYENDLSPSLPNTVPGREGENTAQHMVTYTVAFGLTGNNLVTPPDHDPSTPPPPWPSSIAADSPETLDDMQHAAFNGRGLFLNASDTQELITSLADAIADVTQRTTFSTSSVSINSQVLRTGTLLFQAIFDSGDFTGDVRAFTLNDDATIDQQAWSATNSLPLPASRNIFTRVPKSGTMTPIEFLPTDTDLVGRVGNANIINYIRGVQTNEEQNGGTLRDRDGLLGDIVNSSPLSVGLGNFGYGDLPGTEGSSYSDYLVEKGNRFINSDNEAFSVVYTGANDGMLHAFDSRNGVERFAYIPSVLHNSLELLTDPDYGHKFFVDAPPNAGDAYINNSWKTILTGGLGKGGRAIYALDITNPFGFDTNDVMWEFTSANSAELGFVYHQTQTVRLANGRWGVVFGNGFNSNSHRAQLFILDAEDGSLIKRIDTQAGSAASTNGLSMPFVLDTNGDLIADAVYAGDLQGNMWKFNISSGNTNQWDVAFKQGSTPRPLYQARDASNNPQPITSQPTVVQHPDSGFVVLFGTGKFLETGDNTVPASPPIQTFYGIRDNGARVTGGRNDLVAQTITDEITVFDEDSVELATARLVSDNPVDYGNKKGWYLDLISPVSGAEGERVIANPLVRFGRVIFNTLIPAATPCEQGGRSFLMELNAVNGARLENSVFDYNNDGIIDASDLIDKDGNLIPGSGISIPATVGSPAIIAAGDGSIEYKLTSGIETGITTTAEDPGTSTIGRQSWKQLR